MQRNGIDDLHLIVGEERCYLRQRHLLPDHAFTRASPDAVLAANPDVTIWSGGIHKEDIHCACGACLEPLLDHGVGVREQGIAVARIGLVAHRHHVALCPFAPGRARC